MIAFIHDLHFLRPWWGLALLALPLIWIGLQRGANAARNWARVVDSHLLPHLLAGAERSMTMPILLLGSVWCVAVAALAGPAWERLPSPLYRNQAGHVIALELASSMLATDLKPDRLTRARYKIHGLLDRVGDGQTALLGYAGEAFVVAPLTDDVNTVRNLVDSLDPSVMPVAGNATANAIRRGVALLQQAGANGGDILLVADSTSADAVAAAAASLAGGVRVSVLAVGTSQGAPVSLPQGDFLKDSAGNILLPKLEEAALRAVAAAGGGRYVEVSTDARDLDDLLGVMASADTASTPNEQVVTDTWRDRGPWLVLLLLPLAAAGFRRGWLMLLPLCLLILPGQSAHAFELNDLWQRADQQAWSALQDGNAKQAAVVAKDPALRGAAAYREGDFDAAATALQPLTDADAAYNRGNALAKQGKFEEAIAAYDAALKVDPDHADASANRQAVVEWLKQQEQKKNSEQQKQQGNDQQQDKDHKGQQQDSSKGNDSKDGQSGKSQSDGKDQSGQNDADGSKSDQKAQDGKDGKSAAADKDSATGDRDPAEDQQGKDSAAEQQQKKEQYSKAMSQAIKQSDDKPGQPPASAMAPPRTDAEREQDQATQQWLQRVPDDPGGLLRRKFQLEHERRQRQRAAGDQ